MLAIAGSSSSGGQQCGCGKPRWTAHRARRLRAISTKRGKTNLLTLSLLKDGILLALVHCVSVLAVLRNLVNVRVALDQIRKSLGDRRANARVYVVGGHGGAASLACNTLPRRCLASPADISA